MRSILIAALLAAGSAHAMDVMLFTGNEVKVRLYAAPCPIPSLARELIVMGEQPARLAEVHYGGRIIPACWTTKESKVLLMDIEGDAGFIEKSAFEQEPTV